MTNRLKLILSAICAVAFISPAEPAAPPVIHTNASFDEPILYRAISDNGLWAVAERRPDYDGGKVINLTDFSYVTVTCEDQAGNVGRPLDVTDDGSIVVGTYGNGDHQAPAVWSRETGKWTILPYPSADYGGGMVHAVTPDGHWAVGRVTGKVNIWTEATALWDLTTGEIVNVPNLPAPHIDTFNSDPNRFTAISPDGRYLLAHLSPGGYVIYDRETSKFSAPQGKLADGRTARVTVTDMSPNGRYYHGHASVSGQPAYNEDDDTWTNECVYDIETGLVTLLRESTVSELMVWGVANDGTLYAGSGGNGTPMRDFQVYSNGYWYALDQVLWQGYGIDYYQVTQLTNTGTPYAFSGDGRTFASFTDPNRGEGWVIRLNEDMADVCSRVDLMATYEVAPRQGTSLSSLSSIKMGFDRDIELIGDPKTITLNDKDGKQLAKALSGIVDGNRFSFTFRRNKQAAGEKYKIVIPAGMLCMAGTPSLPTKEIVLEYDGRDDVPVAPVEGSVGDLTLRCLDYSSSYLDIPFGCDLALTDKASATLLRADDDEKIADLTLAVTGSYATDHLLLYSTATIPLYYGYDYKVVLAAGSVTDLGAANTSANEEMTFLIHGKWEDVPEDEHVLMSEDFDAGLGNKFMFYEGDHNNPSSAMYAWDFTADTTPWWIARDDIYTYDYAAVSHSSYMPAGTSDDWMVIRRLFIPDDTCRLQFDSQGYKKGAQDYLNVYVIESDLIYSILNDKTIEKFKEERKLIYHELQDPGYEEEFLEDEWTHNDLSLADYAGKYIYIAFVNENTNGSAIFVDNVSVTRNLTFSLSVLSPSSAVDAKEQKISAKLYVNSKALSFDNASMTLYDGDDNVISTAFMRAGRILDADSPFEATFDKPLPLVSGAVNRYKIGIKAGDLSTSFERSFSNLLFETTKRAVLEEYTGAACPNCPDGIVTIEKIHDDFGDKFIPLAIRTYMSDELSPANTNYSSLLGLDALGAPSGCINRRYAGYPVAMDQYGFIVNRAGNLENGLWYDFVVYELAIPSMANIKAKSQVVDDKVSADVELTYAVSLTNLDHSLLGILVEDQVLTYQSNGRYQSVDAYHGEWGQGGKYGSSTVYPYYCDHLVRNVSNANLVGTIGLIPSDVTAGDVIKQNVTVNIPTQRDVKTDNCHLVILLIDNMTGCIDNAVMLPVNGETAEETGSDSVAVLTAGSFRLLTSPGSLTIIRSGSGASSVDNSDSVSVYTADGRLIWSGEVADAVEIPCPSGLVIVRTPSSAAKALIP